MNREINYKDSDMNFFRKVDAAPQADDYTMHMHEKYELYCFISGNAQYIVEGCIYELEPGCMLMMRSAETHRLLVRAPERYERYALHFTPTLIYDVFGDGELLRPFNDRRLGELNFYAPSDFEDITPARIFSVMCGGDERLRRQTVISGLMTLLAATAPVFERKKTGAVIADNSTGKEIIEYINRNIGNELSLSALSMRFHISVSQLCRIFSSSTGTSVGNYVIGKRLVFARQLIEAGVPAQEACRRCGYDDYSAFFRAYKKHFGHPPSGKSRHN